MVLLVRHGATEWSTSGRHTGRTDVELTEFGRAQTLRLRPVLHRVIDEHLTDGRLTVFTSPSARAKQTAALLLPDHAGTAEEVEMLLEVDYGSFEGLTAGEIHDIEPGWTAFTHQSPGGEGPAVVSARCDSFIAKIERVAPGGIVIAFTHGHLSRMLTARLIGMPVQNGSVLYNDTATLAVIEYRRTGMVLTGWNISG